MIEGWKHQASSSSSVITSAISSWSLTPAATCASAYRD
jgi:hypothetical protein